MAPHRSAREAWRQRFTMRSATSDRALHVLDSIGARKRAAQLRQQPEPVGQNFAGRSIRCRGAVAPATQTWPSVIIGNGGKWLFCCNERPVAGLPPHDPWAVVVFNDGELCSAPITPTMLIVADPRCRIRNVAIGDAPRSSNARAAA